MKTDKILACFVTAFAVAVCLASCKPEAKADSGYDVNIDIEINLVSSGFIQATYTPDCPAYYLTSVIKATPNVDPDDDAQAIMDLALDSCYVEYVKWRHTHLLKLEKDIADFPSHVLNYGETTRIDNYLDPDTDYWVCSFVVDKNSNKANGKLFWQPIHTEPQSIFTNVRFAYRVSGEWDYVYPYDKETGELVTTVPWIGKTADSLDVQSLGYASPIAYFKDEFSKYKDDRSKTTFIGIYVHQNNGIGDGTSTTRFEEGHTYYTAMTVFDGPLNESFNIYKFKWEGPDTEYYFNDDPETDGAWK